MIPGEWECHKVVDGSSHTDKEEECGNVVGKAMDERPDRYEEQYSECGEGNIDEERGISISRRLHERRGQQQRHLAYQYDVDRNEKQELQDTDLMNLAMANESLPGACIMSLLVTRRQKTDWRIFLALFLRKTGQPDQKECSLPARYRDDWKS